MIDTIHAYKYTYDLGTLPDRYRKQHRKSPPKKRKWVVEVENLLFKVRPQENGQYRIEVKGSFSKFLKGNNYYNPTYLDLRHAYVKFWKVIKLHGRLKKSEIASRSISRFVITRIDISVNVKLSNLAQDYFPIFQHLRGYTVDRSQKHGIYFNTRSGKKTVLIYDKETELKNQADPLLEPEEKYTYKTLRFECKYQYDIPKVFGFKYFEDLFTKDGLFSLSDELLKQYYRIKKRSSISLDSVTRPKDIADYYLYLGIESSGGRQKALDLIESTCSRHQIPKGTKNKYREKINSSYREKPFLTDDPLVVELDSKILKEVNNYRDYIYKYA